MSEIPATGFCLSNGINMKIDAHCHTNNSDGVVTIKERMDLIRSCGYKAATITDHDYISPEQVGLAKTYAPDMVYIPGIELTTVHYDKTVHVLGYFVDPSDNNLQKHIKELDDREYAIVRKMVEMINKDYHTDMKLDELLTESLHSCRYLKLIKVLAKHLNYNKDLQFEAYYGTLDKMGLSWNSFFDCSVKKAIDLIHGAGGIAVVAHPGFSADPFMDKLGFLDHTEKHFQEYKEMDLDGIETHCPSHKDEQSRLFKTWADKFNFLNTEGSDCHGTDPALGPELMSSFNCWFDNLVENMVACYKHRYGNNPNGVNL